MKTKKRLRLKPEVIRILLEGLEALFYLLLLSIACYLCLCIQNAIDDIDQIEAISEECAKEGKGIKVVYTKEGDEFYVCND